MTYSVNAVALDNPTLGWKLRSTSKPLAALSKSLSSVRVPSRDGVLLDQAASLDATTLLFVVETPRANLESLQALFMRGGVLTSSYLPAGTSAEFEFVSATPTGFGNADTVIDLAVVVRVPLGVWRAGSVTSTFRALGSSSVNITDLLPGISAPIQDPIVRVRGAVTAVRVSDSSTAWFEYLPTIPAGSYLRFDAQAGRAWITTSDTWTGGTEVSGVVTFGGPRGVFELTPYLQTDPRTRNAVLNVYSTVRDGSAAVQVRAQNSRAL